MMRRNILTNFKYNWSCNNSKKYMARVAWRRAP